MKAHTLHRSFYDNGLHPPHQRTRRGIEQVAKVKLKSSPSLLPKRYCQPAVEPAALKTERSEQCHKKNKTSTSNLNDSNNDRQMSDDQQVREQDENETALPSPARLVRTGVASVKTLHKHLNLKRLQHKTRYSGGCVSVSGRGEQNTFPIHNAERHCRGKQTRCCRCLVSSDWGWRLSTTDCVHFSAHIPFPAL